MAQLLGISFSKALLQTHFYYILSRHMSKSYLKSHNFCKASSTTYNHTTFYILYTFTIAAVTPSCTFSSSKAFYDCLMDEKGMLSQVPVLAPIPAHWTLWDRDGLSILGTFISSLMSLAFLFITNFYERSINITFTHLVASYASANFDSALQKTIKTKSKSKLS